MNGAVYIIAIVIIIALAIVGYFINREINSWLYYDAATQQIVCKMVKPEHLTDYGLKYCKQ